MTASAPRLVLLCAVLLQTLLASGVQSAGSAFLSADEVTRFRRDGYLVKRGVIEPAVVEALAAARPPWVYSWYNRWIELTANNFLGSVLVQDTLWLDFPIFRDFWLKGPVPELVASLLPAGNGPASPPALNDDARPTTTDVRLTTDIMYGVPAGVQPRVLGTWHVDTESFDIVDGAGVSAWIPLQAVDADGAGGSLRLASRARYDGCLALSEDGRDWGVTNASCVAHLDRISEVHSYTVGDVLFFTRWTFHRSQAWRDGDGDGGASTPATHAGRYALVGRFTSSDAAFLEPPYLATQKKQLCNHNLTAGEPLRSACFPRVHPAPLDAELAALAGGGVRTPSNDAAMYRLLGRLVGEALGGQDSRVPVAVALVLARWVLPALGIVWAIGALVRRLRGPK